MTNEDLVESIQEGKIEHVEELWHNVEKFINMQASKRINKSGKSEFLQEDLYQCGYFALKKAISGFKRELNVPFISYLNYHLLNEFNTALDLRTTKQKRDPINNAMSLETPIGEEDNDMTIIDILADIKAEQEFDRILNEICAIESSALVRRAINVLPRDCRTYFNTLIQTDLDKPLAAYRLNLNMNESQSLYSKGIRLLRTWVKKHKEELEAMEYYSTEFIKLVRKAG